MMPRSYHPGWLEEKVDRKEEKERLKRDSDKRVRPEVEARMEKTMDLFDGFEKFRFSGEIDTLQEVRKDRTSGYEKNFEKRGP